MFRNTETNYGWISIGLHWLMALLIFFLFGLGLYMVDLSYYDSWYKGSLDLHKSTGLIVMALLLARLAWRLFNPAPHELPGPAWEQRAGQWMHTGLYLVMLLLVCSGYLISTADGRGIVFFDWLELPALPWGIDNQEDLAGKVHAVLAWSLMTMVAMHALAAVKHQLINRDNGLLRMVRAARS